MGLFWQTVGFILIASILWLAYAFVGHIAVGVVAGLFSVFALVWTTLL
jgi:hypothetical protein